MYKQPCPSGLVYDATFGECNYPSSVIGCSISDQETTEHGTNNFETMMETTTVTTTDQPLPFTCKGKTDGNYPNPASSCSANFYKCSNGNAYLFVSSFN
jgi:hypothetical protein